MDSTTPESVLSLRPSLLANRAASKMEVKPPQYAGASEDCAESLRLDASNVKTMFRKVRRVARVRALRGAGLFLLHSGCFPFGGVVNAPAPHPMPCPYPTQPPIHFHTPHQNTSQHNITHHTVTKIE
jgi:hypothetical protein